MTAPSYWEIEKMRIQWSLEHWYVYVIFFGIAIALIAWSNRDDY